jgi:hypothetical protein
LRTWPPTEINPDYIEQKTFDQIMDTKKKGTYQQNIQLYRVIKSGQLLHQGKWLTMSQIQQKFPHLMKELDTMETISSQGGRTDLGGYQWPPTYSTNSE